VFSLKQEKEILEPSKHSVQNVGIHSSKKAMGLNVKTAGTKNIDASQTTMEISI
jgi:hypothetical protein